MYIMYIYRVRCTEFQSMIIECQEDKLKLQDKLINCQEKKIEEIQSAMKKEVKSWSEVLTKNVTKQVTSAVTVAK